MNALFLAFPFLIVCCDYEPDVELRDLSRFPPAAVVASYRAFAVAHNDWITRQRQQAAEEGGECGLYDFLCSWELESDHCLGCRSLLEGALAVDLGVTHRLYCLRRLRDALGRAAYFRGAMPPPAPLGYFRQQD